MNRLVNGFISYKTEMMKKRLLISILAIILGLIPISAYAEAVDNIETENVSVTGSMKQVEAHVDVLENQDEGSDVIVSFESGSMIMVIDESDDWYTVSYQGKTGYISKKASPDAIVDNVSFTENVQSLDEEFAEESAQMTLIAEEVERYRAERKRSIIWGTIIVLLVIGVFATGIISSLQNAKKDAGNDEEGRIEEENVTEEDIEDNTEEPVEGDDIVPESNEKDDKDGNDEQDVTEDSWDDDLVKIEV